MSAKLIDKLGVTQEIADSRIASIVVGERTKDGIVGFFMKMEIIFW